MAKTADKAIEGKTRRPVRKTFTQPSLTQQSFIEECDINNIMAKYQKYGLLDHVAKHQGNYGDFIGYPDFHESMNAVREAEAMFMSIPSEIRARFDNSPEAFLQFAQDEDNHDEMVELGLIPNASNAKPVEDVPATPEEPKAPAAEPASPEA